MLLRTSFLKSNPLFGFFFLSTSISIYWINISKTENIPLLSLNSYFCHVVFKNGNVTRSCDASIEIFQCILCLSTIVIKFIFKTWSRVITYYHKTYYNSANLNCWSEVYLQKKKNLLDNKCSITWNIFSLILIFVVFIYLLSNYYSTCNDNISYLQLYISICVMTIRICRAKRAEATDFDLYQGIHMADPDGNSCFSDSPVQF